MKTLKQFICLFVLFFTFLYANTIYAANDTLQIGNIVTVEADYEKSQWLTVDIIEDGMYEFTGICKSMGDWYLQLWNEIGDGNYITAGERTQNSINQTTINSFQCYLHKGKYNLKILSSYYLGEEKFNISYKKIDTSYFSDKEPNDSSSGAIAVKTNQWYSGYIDGNRSDGSVDEKDLYVFQGQTGTYELLVESTGDVSLGFLTILEDGSSNCFFRETAKKNEIENVFKLNKKIEFTENGKYYIEIMGDNGYTGYSHGYKFMLSAGSGVSAEFKAPDAISTAVGIKVNWDNSNNAGYRVYRAEAGQPPMAVSDVVYGNSFVDVNVESNKKYYYIVVPESENIVTEIEENLKTETITETILQPENTGVKNFILMKIGNPNMTVGERILEIDPGRATVPVIQNGRTLVPIRAIIEAMDGTVDWNEAERKVTLNAKNHNVEMWLGKKEFIVDGIKKEMDVAPDTINNRTMLPIRFVTENVGCQIEWIGTTEEIIIVF